MTKGKSKGTTAPVPQVGVRLDEELLALVDAEVARLQAELPGMTVSRADVVRNCVARCLRPPKGKR